MHTSSPTTRAQDSSGLLVAFLATAALVLGVAGRGVVVDAFRAAVPPALEAIVLPTAPPARAEVAAAPPAPPTTTASATPAAAGPTPPSSSRSASLAPSTRRAGTAAPTTTARVIELAAVPIASVTPLDTTSPEPARSLAGASSPPTTAANDEAGGASRRRPAHHKAGGGNGNGPSRHAAQAKSHAEHPEHAGGSRHSGR